MIHLIKYLLLFVLMAATSGMAVALRPTHRIADDTAPVNLDAMIPKAFGEWREEPQNTAQIVDAQQKQVIDRIYAQTLSRNYINANGYRMMLSIAYGKDQDDSHQVHKPEICYPAQGFILKSKRYDHVDTGFGSISVTRVETSLGSRNEPITYWITVGDRVVGPRLDKKLVEMSYGLRGQIPDGMLVRISSIDPESPHAFQIQNQFLTEMLTSSSPQTRQRIIGTPKREQQ
ncbi:exosortase-associated protein EpsI, B-type [Dechloromonas sp. HYN0024]|uniref:exosortase-associated protein EpsI, B-type n=1 Tax=Dechloromonas sp. HYN0024 TaxID=2231055 RepID=UPI000E4494E4|nr:exosortase-associated protein EpsI, B-type [Dechloromonas sp. HYN0024]AXS80107.1 EpsI family protein [Dechloromonas sp. HYN0024]